MRANVETWRRRAVYAAMSIFVAWHATALMTAPMPEDAKGLHGLRALFRPYVTLFGLDNQWSFYAPNINPGFQFRYRLETAEGTPQTFVPVQEVSWYEPRFWWVRQWQDAIVDAPEINADLAGKLFCRKHSALKPTAVTLLKIEQKDFFPDDFLRGAHPMDAEFVNEKIVKRVPCPTP